MPEAATERATTKVVPNKASQDWFLYGVIVPVLPFALVNQSGVAQDDVQLWSSVLLALCGGITSLFSPLCGYVADHTTSRRLPLLIGLIFLASGTTLLCIGTSLPVLAIGRVLEGLSAAVIYTVGPALVVDTVQKENIAQAMGWVGWAMTIGTIISPLLGGVVFDRAGYRPVFAMVFALTGIDILLRLGMIEKKTAKKWPLAVLNHEGDEETAGNRQCEPRTNDSRPLESSPVALEDPDLLSIFSFLSSKALLFPPKFQRPPAPALFALSTDIRLLVALWAIFAQAILMTSFDAVLALFVQSTFSWHATAAGLCFLPLLIPAFFGPIIGHLGDRYGAKWPATLGFLLATPAFVCLRFVTHNSLAQKVLLCALLAIVGLALTCVLVPMMGEIAAAVAAREGDKAYAQGYGLFNLAYGGGLVAGSLMAGTLRDRCGWAVLTLVLGCLSAASALVVGGLTGPRGRDRGKGTPCQNRE